MWTNQLINHLQTTCFDRQWKIRNRVKLSASGLEVWKKREVLGDVLGCLVSCGIPRWIQCWPQAKFVTRCLSVNNLLNTANCCHLPNNNVPIFFLPLPSCFFFFCWLFCFLFVFPLVTILTIWKGDFFLWLPFFYFAFLFCPFFSSFYFSILVYFFASDRHKFVRFVCWAWWNVDGWCCFIVLWYFFLLDFYFIFSHLFFFFSLMFIFHVFFKKKKHS